MEKETEIHSVGADFMQVCGPEVFMPSEVIISVSNDGKEFKMCIRDRIRSYRQNIPLGRVYLRQLSHLLQDNSMSLFCRYRFQLHERIKENRR